MVAQRCSCDSTLHAGEGIRQLYRAVGSVADGDAVVHQRLPAVACARKLFADALLYDMVIVIEEDALCVNVKMHFRDFFKLIGSCDLAVYDAVAVIFSRVFSKGFFIGT